jgi:hypothetical protein
VFAVDRTPQVEAGYARREQDMAKRRATNAAAGSNVDRQILSALKEIKRKLDDIEGAINAEIARLDDKLDEILSELRSQPPAYEGA